METQAEENTTQQFEQTTDQKQQSIPDTNRALSISVTSVSMSSEKYLGESRTHLKWQQITHCVAAIILFLILLSYLIYGVTKRNESIRNPETKTYLQSVSSYEVPLMVICSDAPRFGDIVVTELSLYDDNNYTSICDINPCDAIGDIVTPLNRTSWQQLNYTGWNEDSRCLAIIPSKGATFESRYQLDFVFVPYNLSRFDDSSDSFLEMIENDKSYYNNYFNVLHPDLIDSWHKTLQTRPNNELFPWFHASLWSFTDIEISLYTSKTLSGDVSRVYGTKFYKKYYERDILSYNVFEFVNDTKYINNVFPRFRIGFDANQQSVDEYAIPDLFHSYSEEYQQYTAWDIISGLGGVLSFTLKSMGIIIGILLAAEYLPYFMQRKSSFHGLAPYPLFEPKHEERLRRLIHKEIEAILQKQALD